MGEMFQVRLLFQGLAVLFNKARIEHAAEGGETQKQLLRFRRQITVRIVDAA